MPKVKKRQTRREKEMASKANATPVVSKYSAKIRAKTQAAREEHDDHPAHHQRTHHHQQTYRN